MNKSFPAIISMDAKSSSVMSHKMRITEFFNIELFFKSLEH